MPPTDQPTDRTLLDALDVAAGDFTRRVAGIGPDRWQAPTPCDEWDVRFLVVHVVGGNRFAGDVLDGASLDEAMNRVLATPQLGDDPEGAARSSHDEQRRRFRAPGALARTISHPTGPVSGRRFLEMRVYDVALHTWDLARATGADDTLDPDLVATVVGIFERSWGGAPDPLGRVADDAPLQHRLLDMTGRDPDWVAPRTSQVPRGRRS